ncbi:tryptophan synthase subunit alpha [Paenibacillus pinistramenti]|uniref:tryptophan synthase subunit alpha n=1 Tax=Paenibacillus pinistramenti TaxID=1768003 RepID=UPI00110993D8|nr:tryptophan synthase subunit alpha [Paenibacillus pinistramenti]
MNLIDAAFNRLKQEGRAAFIPFLTVGDPDLDTSVDLIAGLEQAGADILELGVPYSDPLADGPVIQRASERALLHHVTIESCFQVAGEARRRGVQIPFVLFTYYNPVLQVGLEKFMAAAAEHGISGLIIPDLPYEECSEVLELADKANIHLIPLVAPTSEGRIQAILEKARGFVYCVSSLGVTGVRSSFHEGIEAFIQSVKQATPLPVAVGFGISSHEQVERFSAICDGVVIGSAIVREVETQADRLLNESAKQDALLQICNFVSQLKGYKLT